MHATMVAFGQGLVFLQDAKRVLWMTTHEVVSQSAACPGSAEASQNWARAFLVWVGVAQSNVDLFLRDIDPVHVLHMMDFQGA